MEYNINKQHEEFFEIIQKTNLKDSESLEAYIHALIDINQALHHIYNEFIPDIIKNSSDVEFIKERLWDIREEFRHIDYHINDAELLE